MKGHFGELAVDEMLILKWSLRKENVRLWTEFDHVRVVSSGGIFW